MADTIRYSYKTLKIFCEKAFYKLGFDENDSKIITDVLLISDLYGIESHGMQRLIRYHKGIEKGLIKVEAKPEIVNGAGSAGTAIANHLLKLGIKNIIMCDKFGILCEGMDGLNEAHKEMSLKTNKQKLTGNLVDAMKGADVFIGVSAPNVVSEAMVESMAENSIVFPMANPVPEIMPDKAIEAGASIVGTGRSDFPNQINNVLAFPGIFRGALDVRASDINEEMKMAASYAIASLVSDEELNAQYILPKAFDQRIGKVVAKAVAQGAKDSGVARI